MGRYGLAAEEAKRKKDEEDRGVVVDNASTAAAAGVGDEAMEEGSTPSESNDKGKAKEDQLLEDRKKELTPRLHTPAAGMISSIDSIGSIPTAFGAICLNIEFGVIPDFRGVGNFLRHLRPPITLNAA